MLKVDLARLERDRQVDFQAEVPADDPLWADSALDLAGPLRVDLTVSETASGEVVVRGTLEGSIRQQCRRCLEEVLTPVDQDLTLVYAPPDGLEEGEPDEEIRTLSPSESVLDLGTAIREELILTADPYVVCDDTCRGLCPHCGVDLNEETCDCTRDERDPRWDALRALKNE